MNNSEKIKSILIDPFDQSISIVDLDKGLDPMYKVLQCRLIDYQHLGNNHDLVMDDEGRLKEDNRWFKLAGHSFAGRCLIVDCDEEGYTVSTTLTIDKIKQYIKFLDEGYYEEPYMEFRAL